MNDEIIPLEDDVYEEEIEVEEETDVMNAVWGNISGNIENQTDLQQALDAKQDNLTQAQLDAVNSGITSAKVATYDGYPAQITSAVSSEADIRRQADTTLQGNIDAEERARKAADKDIQDVLDGETLARQNADTALGGRIDTEIHDRQVADNGLQSQIDAITSKSDVVDVVASYAALQAYDTSTLGNNDVVKVLDDETHGDAMTYYRWSTTTQTWSYIGQEAPYYTKSQTDTLLLDKQDKIDATHKLSADLVDDTSTTNKFVTAEDKTAWNAKQDALTAGNNIDITDGVISTPAIAPEVVAELPATGTEGKLYLTPKNYTRGTGTGNPIEATITEEAGAIESFQLDGDTFQQSYEGKNLFDIEQYINATLRTQGDAVSLAKTNSSTLRATNKIKQGYNFCGIPIPNYTELLGKECTASGKVTLSGVALTRVVFAWNNNGVSVFGTSLDISQNGSFTYTATIPSTVPSGATGLMLVVYANGNSNAGDVGSYVDWSELQLEESSTATSFEPYVGGTPSPNPSYPQPIQTVTGEQTVEVVGKNLFNETATPWLDHTAYNSSGEMVNWGGYVGIVEYQPVEPETTYTFSNSLNVGIYYGLVYYDANKVKISNITASTTTFTTPANCRYIRFAIGNNVTTTPTWAQLEKGSTATSYAPYHATSYPINLGKNLFDNTGWRQGQYNNGEWTENLVTRATTPLIPIEPTTYTISLNSESLDTAFININYFDSSKNWLGNRSTLGLPAFETVSREQTFTLPRGASYLAITLRPYGEDGANIQSLTQSSLLMLEKGSSKTTYAPYKTPIELCKLDTYQDYIWKDGEDWKVHKEVGTVVANASSEKSWIKSGQSTATVFVAAWSNMLSGDFVHTLDDKLYAQNFSYSNPTVANTARFNKNAGATEYNFLLLRFDINTFDTLGKVKTWLNNNPQTIYYKLATATDTAITDQALIAQLEAIRTASLQNGANTITNTATSSNLAGDMEIGYYGFAPRNRYDKWLWLDLNNEYEQIGS